LISSDQIEDWIHEIEERPASAGVILRSIAARLVELDKWNNELLSDNIELRSGNRVEEYEARVAALEYQLELIKRQVSGAPLTVSPSAQPASLLVFQPNGRVLRLPIQPEMLVHGKELARFAAALDLNQPAPSLLFANPSEELLFVFDSGRTVTLAVKNIKSCTTAMNWDQAHRIDPRPGEELAAVLPIADLAMYDFCAQVSRRACAKLMPKTSFQALLARGTIGAGIKRRPDKTAALALCGREGRLVLATREGWLLTLPASQLPYTVDEVIQLSVSDYVVAFFNPLDKKQFIAITQSGKIIHRETNWFEPAASFKSRGQALFSPARRETGVRVIGAAAVDSSDWGAVLRADGSLLAVSVGELISASVLETSSQAVELAAFTLLGLRKVS
jgi:DNA gyrase/topoisomerase IV subunit A